MHRLDRYCRITMEERLQMRPRQQLLNTAKVYLERGKKDPEKGKIQLFLLKQLLESYGCTYKESKIADEVVKRLPIAMKKFEIWGNANPSEEILPSAFEDVVAELEARDRAQDKRTTSGSLVNCFPLHYDGELNLLRERWGTFSWKFFMGGCGKHGDTAEGSAVSLAVSTQRQPGAAWSDYSRGG